MSLREFRKYKEPGFQAQTDVRSFGLPPKTEKPFYPIPAELEPPHNQKDWNGWIEHFYEVVDKHQLDVEMGMEFVFGLKVLNPDYISRLLTPAKETIMKGWLLAPSSLRMQLAILSKYCFIFNKTLEQVNPNPRLTKTRLFDEFASDIHKENYASLLANLVSVYILFPEFLPPTVLEIYWPLLSQFFKEHKGFRLAASLRILYPEHIQELEFSPQEVQFWGSVHERSTCTYLAILARPEIPGLTTWPPKKTREPQLGDNTPEQPENLKL